MGGLLITPLLLLIASLSSLAWSHPSLPRAASGCGKPLPSFVAPYFTLTSSGKTRGYLFHLPEDYDSGTAYPVVVGFHGSSQDGLAFATDTGLSAANYSGGTLMVYPDGADGNWAGPSYAKTPVPEDLQFVADLLANVQSNFCVDDARIYATGMSNGAGFVGTLACSPVGGQFAAFAPVAGSFYTDVNGTGCAPARRPLPMLEIHGAADTTVPYAGGSGEGGALPAIPTWLGYWEERDGCTGTPNNDTSVPGVSRLSWTCDGSDGVLQHYKVEKMVHEWPMPWPTLSGIVAGDLNGTAIDANLIIMNFFKQWSK